MMESISRKRSAAWLSGPSSDAAFVVREARALRPERDGLLGSRSRSRRRCTVCRPLNRTNGGSGSSHGVRPKSILFARRIAPRQSRPRSRSRRGEELLVEEGVAMSAARLVNPRKGWPRSWHGFRAGAEWIAQRALDARSGTSAAAQREKSADTRAGQPARRRFGTAIEELTQVMRRGVDRRAGKRVRRAEPEAVMTLLNEEGPSRPFPPSRTRARSKRDSKPQAALP